MQSSTHPSSSGGAVVRGISDPQSHAGYSVDTHGELQPGLPLEWLLTNGTGAYASSTVVGCNTRRYHGLLVSATKPPVGREMSLSRLGEIVRIFNGDADPASPGAGEVHELAVNQFGHTFHPRGERYLKRFEVSDIARWTYDVAGVRITKELLLLWGRNVAAVRYHVDPGPSAAGRRAVELSVLPFVALRDFHAMRRGKADLRTSAERVGADSRRVSVEDPSSGIRVFLESGAGQFVEQGDWWYGQTYAVETDRGQDDAEDLFTPGRFVLPATSSPATLTIVASASAFESPDMIDFDSEIARRREAIGPAPRETIAVRRLTRAASDFIVARSNPDGSRGTTVIAGYPWFADWGRDTMISLPGLFLVTRRFDEAKAVLKLFAEYVSDGMIPNRFDDYTNQPHYNTVDASLWYVHAAHEYARLSGDATTFARILRPACEKILDGYAGGTRFGIHMDPADGLIAQGDAHTQLTWMDAKCADVAFTPRQGKPVEINALWYNALRLMGRAELADRVKASFAKVFWNSPFRGLYDVVDAGDSSKRDAQVRPNQIYAVSLTHSPLNAEQQAAVVEVVRRELLTPVGLRTLAPQEKGYRASYRGDQFTRDGTYHNGMAWPWLIGGFLEAYLKVNNGSPASIAQARAWLQPLVDHLTDTGCLGQIAEIFEPEAPHRPVGCLAQAWSVAEILRLAVMLEM